MACAPGPLLPLPRLTRSVLGVTLWTPSPSRAPRWWRTRPEPPTASPATSHISPSLRVPHASYVTRNPLAAHSDRDHKHTQAAPRCPSPKGWAHHGLNPTSRLTLRCVGIICPRVRLLVSLGEYPMQDCHSIVHNCIGKCILGN